MIDEDEVTRTLTVAEIHLLRQIAQWRRKDDLVTFYLTRRGQGFGGPTGFAEWIAWNERLRASVVWDRGVDGKIGYLRDYRRESYTYIKPESVGQAVDLLVALGYLPKRFSSAYRAGWDGRATATDADGALDLVTWPGYEPAVPSC